MEKLNDQQCDFERKQEINEELHYIIMQSAGIDREKYDAGHILLSQNGKINEHYVKLWDVQNDFLMEYHKIDKKSLKDVDFERFMYLY